MRNAQTPILMAALVFVAVIVSFMPAPYEASTAWGAVPATTMSREVSESLTALAVKAKLLEALGADALRISVQVSGKTATLSGAVAERASRKLAGEVALSVSGVSKVDNQVVEKAPEPAVRNAEADVKDAALLTKVKTVLLSDIGVNALKIDVSTTDGIVTLRGKLGSRELNKEAVAKAQSVNGVAKVIDLLE